MPEEDDVEDMTEETEDVNDGDESSIDDMIFEGQIRGYVDLSIKLYRTQCNFKIIFSPVLQKHVLSHHHFISFHV